MANRESLARDFYGSDPLKGEDACCAFLTKDDTAIPFLLGSYHAANNSHQVAFRLKALTAAQKLDVSSILAKTIENGPWRAKGAASACYAGLRASDTTTDALVHILECGHDMDAKRLAIEALGFLRADGWSSSIEDLSVFGQWISHSYSSYSKYYFEKLSSYVIQAFVRFCGNAGDDCRGQLFEHFHDYVQLRQEKLPNVGPDAFQLVRQVSY